jgi:hypothetical protein
MNPSLWNSLEMLSTQAGLLVEWKAELGADFAAARVFLRPTQQQVESYPCQHSNPCGCRHRIIFESPEDVCAICDCEEDGCEAIQLGPGDLIVYALDGKMLAASIRRAFHLDEINNGAMEGVRSYPVGVWGIRRSHVFFNVPISESGLLNEIDRLCVPVADAFVLLTPTPRFCTPRVQQALQRQGCGHMALDGVLKLTPGGILQLIPAAKAAVDVFFGDFGKQVAQGKPLELAIARVEAKLDAIAKSRSQAMAEEDEFPAEVARQALALVKQLDTENRLKKPSILTVFRLYCINEMSATEIAKQCCCSKASIIKRLNILARKTGMPAARLRQYSAQFERMEAEMGDWRAKRIRRRELVDDNVTDETDAD